MLEMALVDPPNYYDITMPASYAEAKQRMLVMGRVMVDLIDEQPLQQTTAQLLTAQTIKDMGRGWSGIFTLASDSPAEASDSQARFQWQPEGRMAVVLPDSYPSGVCEYIVEPMVRSATWHHMLGTLRGSESIAEVEGLFRDALVETYKQGSQGSTSILSERMDEAATEVFSVLFRRKENRGAIFNSFTIDWGDDGSGCLNRLYAKARS